MKKLLRLNPKPDGVFCCNDPIALGAIQAILEAGLDIPGDRAIIGRGNAHYDNLLCVPLTSIDQNTDGLSENAAKLALNIIKRKSPGAPKSDLLNARLSVRRSTER